MTALDTNIGGPSTLGGTLAATLGTLNGGTLGGGNNKKMSKAFGNAWRGAAAYTTTTCYRSNNSTMVSLLNLSLSLKSVGNGCFA